MKTKSSRWSEEYRNTANRKVFNRLHKFMLEQEGSIHCSICGYHRGDNCDKKFYGETRIWRNKGSQIIRYPNWKLVSKKRKQWMDKTYRKEICHSNRLSLNYYYVKFKF